METDLLHAMDSPGQAVQGHRPLKDEPGGQVDWRGGQKYRHVTDETPGLSILSAPRTPAQGGWMDSGQRGNTQDIHGHTLIFFLWLSGRLVRVLVSSLAVHLLVPLPLDTSLLPPLLANSHSLLICSCNLYT